MKIILINIFSLLAIIGFGQVDTLNSPQIFNSDAITNFFNKLNNLENDVLDKVKISHIGDSHIQADFFTGEMRNKFQNKFGNGGYGFSFPYKLSKTNGTKEVKFVSNVKYKADRNIFADTNLPVGLSGYSFISSSPNTAIKITTTPKFSFNTIKILSTNNNSEFADFTSAKDFNKLTPKYSVELHTVKSGDVLSVISGKYDVSVAEIKKANNLKSNTIYIGKKLKIPIKQMEKINIEEQDFSFLESLKYDGITSYHSSEYRNEIFVFNKNVSKNFALNGFIFEKDEKGIIYNTIGVNGAKCIDYNKFPLFFTQLNVLESDLVIISSGTNESFDNLSPDLFIKEMLLMIENIRNQNPNIEIIITTPPPSLFKKKHKNTFIPLYIEEIMTNMYTHNYAVWDMYQQLGGHEQINQNYSNKLVARDRIHYTKAGYNKQAELFYEDLMFFYISK